MGTSWCNRHNVGQVRWRHWRRVKSSPGNHFAVSFQRQAVILARSDRYYISQPRGNISLPTVTQPRAIIISPGDDGAVCLERNVMITGSYSHNVVQPGRDGSLPCAIAAPGHDL